MPEHNNYDHPDESPFILPAIQQQSKYMGNIETSLLIGKTRPHNIL